MENDRGERVDLSARRPELARELKADYAHWFKDTKKPMAWDEQNWKALAPKLPRHLALGIFAADFRGLRKIGRAHV